MRKGRMACSKIRGKGTGLSLMGWTLDTPSRKGERGVGIGGPQKDDVGV
jgi:hypothetical protein